MSTKSTLRTAGAIAMFCLAVGATSAGAQNLSIDWYTVDSGGYTFSTDNGLVLGGTCGQVDAGFLSYNRLELYGGFWMGGATVVTAAEDLPEDPAETIAFGVRAGVPNPFADQTGILLSLPDPRPVEVAIFDHTGRLIRVLCEREMAAGHHRFTWDGRSHGGHRVASGIYLVKVRAGLEEVRSRVILLR